MRRRQIVPQALAGIVVLIVAIILEMTTSGLAVLRYGFMIIGALLMLHLGLSLRRAR